MAGGEGRRDSRRLNYQRREHLYTRAEREIPGSLSEGIEEAQRDRGAPENGDLRDRRGCGWLRGSSLMASSSSSSSSSSSQRRPQHHRIRRQRDAPVLIPTGHSRVYKGRLRGVYIIRSRLESNIMNHASPAVWGPVYNGVVGRSASRGIPHPAAR